MVKQYIIIRKDLKMRRGKEIAQGSHASIAWLSDRVRESNQITFRRALVSLLKSLVFWKKYDFIPFSADEKEWMGGIFTKVCLQVEDEKELLWVHSHAVANGLAVSLIRDAGLTEFNGVPTLTCVGIGPGDVDKIKEVTGKLKLY